MSIYLSTSTPSLGIVHVAPNVCASVPEREILVCLARHMLDDHGDVTIEEVARCQSGESLSLYGPQRKHWVYVKTAADGLSTIVFFADDFERVVKYGSALAFAELANTEGMQEGGRVESILPEDAEQRLHRIIEHFMSEAFHEMESLRPEERAGHIYQDLEAVFLWLSQATCPRRNAA